MSQHKVIMFDVDGVLADFVHGFTAAANRLFGTQIITTKEQPTWNFSTHGLLTRAQEDATWDWIKQEPWWWSRLPALVAPNVFRRIDDLRLKADVLFVTSRVSQTTPPGEQTKRWLYEHGIGCPAVIVSKRKGEIARAVGATHSLDDKIENAWAVHWISDSPQTASYLLNRPYNRLQDLPEVGAPGVLRVDSVEAFLDIVEKEE